MSELAPIRRDVIVPAAPAVAFRVFTDRIGEWWPVAEFSVHGAGSAVAFVGNALVESAPGQPDAVWGSVTVWDPPDTVAFSWHPGGEPDRASQVRVTFAAAGEQTLVHLEHSGWEKFANPAQARSEYEHGWPDVFDRYVDAVKGAAEWTWVALQHRPGPAAAGVDNIFADPRFGEHVAFLERMHAARYLVAAGPFGDEPGAGMTVLRLPGADRLDEATRLASIDDASVAGGFFTVDVRPWHVGLAAELATR